jgi:hypothetical protein
LWLGAWKWRILLTAPRVASPQPESPHEGDDQDAVFSARFGWNVIDQLIDRDSLDDNLLGDRRGIHEFLSRFDAFMNSNFCSRDTLSRYRQFFSEGRG